MSSHDSANSYISSASDADDNGGVLGLEGCMIFCTPLLPFLNGDWTVMELPIRSFSTMSPVGSMSPVHSSALELPLRHSMESTAGDFDSGRGVRAWLQRSVHGH
ncbi:hypothetical protein EV2_029672 [Malus domestica]